MPRKFKTANYAETLKLSITLDETLPASHLARFMVDVIGQLDRRAMYARYGPATFQACEQRGIDPYIATGRAPHHQSWQTLFDEQLEPPPADASPRVKMAYKLQTEIGQAIYRLRKCTVEAVIGIIKEVLGFRQLSLRGLVAAAGEWGLTVCLAFNLKRLHRLMAD